MLLILNDISLGLLEICLPYLTLCILLSFHFLLYFYFILSLLFRPLIFVITFFIGHIFLLLCYRLIYNMQFYMSFNFNFLFSEFELLLIGLKKKMFCINFIRNHPQVLLYTRVAHPRFAAGLYSLLGLMSPAL
jgi:hypothetical protein